MTNTTALPKLLRLTDPGLRGETDEMPVPKVTERGAVVVLPVQVCPAEGVVSALHRAR